MISADNILKYKLTCKNRTSEIFVERIFDNNQYILKEVQGTKTTTYTMNNDRNISKVVINDNSVVFAMHKENGKIFVTDNRQFYAETDGVMWQQQSFDFKHILSNNKKKIEMFFIEEMDDEEDFEEGLETHKLVFVKKGKDTININGQKVAAQKLVLKSNLVPAFVWSGVYWVRESDGMLLKSVVPEEGPGSPKEVIELVQ